MEIGERWVYRAHRRDEAVDVTVLAIGTKTPLRAKVSFVDDQFEGRTDWVPLVRLKVPWAARHDYVEREARWSALLAEGVTMTLRDDKASEYVFDVWNGAPVQRLHTSREKRNTVARIDDWSELQRQTGLTRQDLWSPIAISQSDGDLLPWPAALTIARRYAERHSVSVLEALSEELAECLRTANRRRSGFWGDGVDFDEVWVSESRDVLETVRDWCGVSQSAVADEIAELRGEVANLTAIIRDEVVELIDSERSDLAWGLFQRTYPKASKLPWLPIFKLDRDRRNLEAAATVDRSRPRMGTDPAARAALIDEIGLLRDPFRRSLRG